MNWDNQMTIWVTRIRWRYLSWDNEFWVLNYITLYHIWDFKLYVCSITAGFSSRSKKEGSSTRHPDSFNPSESSSGEVFGSLNFTFQDINQATKNFSQNNVIGDGGFGTVYKGQLKDGTLVAIKRAKKVKYMIGWRLAFK